MSEGDANVPHVQEWLVRQIAERLGLPVDEIAVDRPFDEFGLASRDAVALSGELEDLVGKPLRPTLLWEHPTIERLSEFLVAGESEAEPAVRSARSEPDEPIAVIGVGCRFPGAGRGASGFWELLRTGADGIGVVPEGRWEGFGASAAAPEVLETLPRAGGFLDGVDAFDAEFFGISPREAKVMDPQQRLLLEVAWESLEHAGLVPSTLRGSATGVFVGVSSSEYSHLTTPDLRGIDAWTGTGAASSIIANRLSYFLDLRGPSLVVDTACSSSLVAVHQACASLRSGESRTALAAGVNLLLSPAITTNFHHAGALASDGRCKAFDAAADGIVRGEGCGVVVLKRLSDANRDGDRIMALVRGSSVNSDGRSNGLMAPNQDAQAALLRTAYSTADLDMSLVDYVEAHGTGTLLGDPIEAEALSSALGRGRPDDQPLLLGSVKTNIGHLEAAAGIASLIKVVLGMRHDEIPPSLHYEKPNPHIPFGQARLEVVDDARKWPRYSGIARAGVSGFGFGGTNAHVVVEEWPDSPMRTLLDDGLVHTLHVSGSSEARMRCAAADLANWLDSPAGQSSSLNDVGHTLRYRRAQQLERGAVVGRDRNALIADLRVLADGGESPTAVRGRGSTRSPGVVWVFSGYGSQWLGMCRRLLDDEPAFAAAVQRIEAEFVWQAGFSLREALLDDTKAAGNVRDAQLCLFGVQVALAELWRAHGVEPAAVIGHSMGEVAAAVVTGVLDFPTGLRVMVARSELLSEVDRTGTGAMAVVESSATELARLFPEVSIAVHASPHRCTVAGPTGEIDRLVAHVEQRGGMARRLNVTGAGHTEAVDPVLDRLRAELHDVKYAPPASRFYSTSSDGVRVDPAFDVEYWVRNLRSPVRFDQAVRAAAEDGFDTFVELSPHPVTTVAIEECLAEAGVDDPVVVFSSRRDTDDTKTFHANLAMVHVTGRADVMLDRYQDARLAELPPPTWQHRRHWVTARPFADRGGHPLLGSHVELPAGNQHVWQGQVDTDRFSWLSDHRVHDAEILPGTAYFEMVLAAAVQAFGVGAGELRVERLDLHQLLPISGSAAVTTTLAVEGSDSARVEVHTKSATGRWTCHASAEVRLGVGEGVGAPLVDVEGTNLDLYAVLRSAGQHYGPAFQGIKRVRAADGAAVADVELPEQLRGNNGFIVHPALADACLQSLIAAAVGPGSPVRDSGLFVPVTLGAVRVLGDVPAEVRCHAELTANERTELTGSVLVTDLRGAPVLEFGELRARSLDARSVPKPITDAFLETVWESEKAPSGRITAGSWLVVGDGDQAASALRAAGHRVVTADSYDSADIANGLDRLADGTDHPVRGVLVVVNTSGDVVQRIQAAQDATARIAGVVREMDRQQVRGARLWLAADRTDEFPTGLRALVRVLALEHPELRASMVTLEDAGTDSLVAELLADSDEDEIRWRGNDRRVTRLRNVDFDPVRTNNVVRPGAYVVTGGLGGLGLAVVRWLVDGGARRVVLNGRSQPSEDAAAEIARLSEGDIEVEVITGDVSSEGVAEQLVQHATREDVPLRGVVHAAGVLHDVPVVELDEGDVEQVWRAKVRGGWRLHEATAKTDLDWWLVFSSVAGLLGSPGQAAYATANAWLDELALWRLDRGLPATSIQWGMWGEVGRAGDALTALGDPFDPAEGIEALEAVLAARRPMTAVARVDAARALDFFPELGARPFFQPMMEGIGEETGDTEVDIAALRQLDGDEAVARIIGQLTGAIAGILGTVPEQVDARAPLTSLGLDSLMAMRARNAVERDFGLSIPAPLLLRGASLADLAAHLGEELGLAAGTPVTAAEGGRSIGPRDATERWIALLWREALDLDTIDVTQDFTSLGGDDVAANEIGKQVGERLGGEVDASELFAAGTVERMSDLVREQFERTASPIRTLRQEGTRTPLFLFHPAGGPTSVYQPLVDRLQETQPCYGLERLDDITELKDKARRYVELIREVQPDGPYRLGGWSFGGCLAYEAAQQLRVEGHEVDFVALIDTILPLPAPGYTEQEWVHERFKRFVDHIERTYGYRLGIPIADIAEFDEQEQMAQVMEALSDPALGIGAGVLHHQHTSYVDARIAERYQPQPYDGRVVLYRAQESEDTTTTLDPRYLRTDEALGWDEVASRLEVVRIPGNHLSMIDPPHVYDISDHLTTILDD